MITRSATTDVGTKEASEQQCCVGYSIAALVFSIATATLCVALSYLLGARGGGHVNVCGVCSVCLWRGEMLCVLCVCVVCVVCVCVLCVSAGVECACGVFGVCLCVCCVMCEVCVLFCYSRCCKKLTFVLLACILCCAQAADVGAH